MPVFAALLRGVNVGGRNLVSMAALADVCAEAGFTSVKTLLQSGNVVFRSTDGKAAAARKLKQGIAGRFGFEPALFLRTGAELRAALAANPFPDAARDDPSHLLIHFIDGKPARRAAAALAAWPGPERAELRGTNLYLHYGLGMGRSKLTGAVLEKALGLPGTGRNWNTVGKLAALCEVT
jgi:uncharacterized protein (DUF1697 family)